jgi:outer membrane protein
MSARGFFIAIGLLWYTPAVPAAAFDKLDIFLGDPLRTMPPVIESGAMLPGDDAPVSCPVSKDFTLPLALIEAIDLALCNNPQIKMAWASIKVQAGALGEARAAYFPTLSATASRLRTHTSYPDSQVSASTNYGNTVNGTLGWRLFDFGAREANREAANRLLIAAIAHHDVALQKTLTSVIQSYFDAQTAKTTLQAKEQNETIATSTFDSTQRRAARGVVARSDTLQATTALAKATLEKSRAQGAYQKSLAVLVYALGMSPQTRIVLADDVQDKEKNQENNKETQASRSLQDWLELAQRLHPAIVAARAEWEASQQKITATRSEGLPTADFSINYYKNGFPNQGLSSTESRQTTVGVSVSFPLFDGFSRTYKVKGAQAQAEQRQAQLQDTEQNILMEVVKAHADATAALNNLQASEKLLTAAQESLNTSQRKYEKGAADILEILNTLTALSDAQDERIRSLSEWRSARLRLLANVGVMNRVAVGR